MHLLTQKHAILCLICIGLDELWGMRNKRKFQNVGQWDLNSPAALSLLQSQNHPCDQSGFLVNEILKVNIIPVLNTYMC